MFRDDDAARVLEHGHRHESSSHDCRFGMTVLQARRDIQPLGKGVYMCMECKKVGRPELWLVDRCSESGEKAEERKE